MAKIIELLPEICEDKRRARMESWKKDIYIYYSESKECLVWEDGKSVALSKTQYFSDDWELLVKVSEKGADIKDIEGWITGEAVGKVAKLRNGSFRLITEWNTESSTPVGCGGYDYLTNGRLSYAEGALEIKDNPFDIIYITGVK